MEEFLKKYPLLKNYDISRETYMAFESFIIMLEKKNKEINVISKETAKIEVIRERHIEDSAQAIELIDLNSSIITDIGSGGGMPGIIVSIMLKNMKNSPKIHLYEKSHHKSVFLRNVSRDLNLNTEIMQENIFETENLDSGTIIARAFKPLPIMLDLVCRNFSNYKNLILFMGKNGEMILNKTLMDWDFDFEKKKKYYKQRFIFIKYKKYKKKRLK